MKNRITKTLIINIVMLVLVGCGIEFKRPDNLPPAVNPPVSEEGTTVIPPSEGGNTTIPSTGEVENGDPSYPYEVDLGRPYQDGIFAHNVYVNPDLSATSRKFSAFSVDFYSENAPLSTYWALCNWSMHGGSGAYGGLQNNPNGMQSLISFWEYPDGRVARRIYPDSNQNYFGGEGEGVNCFTNYDWKKNTWYRMVFRAVNKNSTTYVEQWIQDKSNSQWTLLAIFDTELENSYFEGGMSFFMENYRDMDCNSLRSFRLNNIYVQEYGSDNWIPINTAQVSIDTQYGNKRGGFSFGATDTYFWGYSSGSGLDLLENNPDIETEHVYTIRSTDSAPNFDFPYNYGADEYRIELNWSYVTSVIDGETISFPSVQVYLFDGDSVITNVENQYDEVGGECTFYYRINGEMVPVYSVYTHMNDDSTLAGEAEVKLYRDDIRYLVAWETGPDNYYSDCEADIYCNDNRIGHTSYEDSKVRAGTGIWYFGVCSLDNGRYGEYDQSWFGYDDYNW